MNKKKLLKRFLIAFAGALAICACAFISINFINNSQEPQDSNSENAPVYVNNSQATVADNSENSIQKTSTASEEVRYADEIYSPEIASSMADIQKSYNEQARNNDSEKRYEIVKPFITNNVWNFADIFTPGLFPNYNIKASTSTIYWKFDETSRTLNISGDSTKGYKNQFGSGGTPGWKNDDVFYKIKYVVIDDAINPSSCKEWFGCVCADNEKVRLANIASITNLSNLDMTGVTDASYMFTGCDLLSDVSASNMPQNMNSITNMEAMFALTKSITDSSVYEIVSANLNTIANARYAFANNSNVTTLDINSWKFGTASDISYCFGNCLNLKTLKASYETDWSKSNVNAEGVFKNCQSLEAKAGTKTFTYKGNEDAIDANPLSFVRICDAFHDGLFTLNVRSKGAAEIIFSYGESYDGTLSDKGWEGSTDETGGVVYKYFDLETPFTEVLAEWKNSSSGKVTAATKTGYDFVNFDIDDEQKSQTAITDDETLWYIQWTQQVYNIEYYDQGGGAYSGDNESELIKTHTFDKPTDLRDGSKNGITFDGWYTIPACTGNPVKSLGAQDFTKGPIKLYAKWSIKCTATVLKGKDEEINSTVMKGQNWQEDSSGNWYKKFDIGTAYSTILAEWGDSSSWSTATSITKKGMILTGFTPASGSLTQDTEFHAQWTEKT